jgi:mono/diheme cytochrome c family protein
MLTLLLACDTGPALSPEAERGRAVYQANCTACHNPDPALDGSLGPAVKGSSRALLEARLVRGSYPEGYTPKRGTTLMVPLPALSGSVGDLAAYLQ